MKDNLSPEEKLLKLIRGEKKPKPAVEKKPVVAPVLADIKPPAKGPAPARQQKTRFKTPLIYPLMIVVLAFSVISLLAAFIYPLLGLNKIKLPDVEKVDESALTTEVEPEVRPLESYLEGSKSKQIFAATSLADVSPQPVAAVTNTLDLFKDITLVGIISSEPPQAVIEDKKTQKTYYLSRGQAMGDLKVEDIQEGKVILNYLGTKYELYM